MTGTWGGAREGAGRPQSFARADEWPRGAKGDWRLAPLPDYAPCLVSNEVRIATHEDRVLSMLRFGTGLYGLTDEILEEHWHSWASERTPLYGQPATWDETTYAYWRFERGLEREDALAACRAAEEREWARR